MSNNLKLDLNLEAPFIKIVQECIVKSNTFMFLNECVAFKSHKKYLEKEVSNIVNKINQIKKTGSSKGVTNTLESIDQLIAKLNSLKTKVLSKYECIVRGIVQ